MDMKSNCRKNVFIKTSFQQPKNFELINLLDVRFARIELKGTVV